MAATFSITMSRYLKRVDTGVLKPVKKMAYSCIGKGWKNIPVKKYQGSIKQMLNAQQKSKLS